MSAAMSSMEKLILLQTLEMEYRGIAQLHGAACMARDKIKENEYRQQLHAALDKILDVGADTINR